MTRPNPWVALAACCVGTFLTMLDATAVSIAAPEMSTDLKASLDELMWVFNAYVLVLAVMLITCGRLGDQFGMRRTFLIGMTIFVVASGLVVFADTSAVLITLRAIQGLGAAFMLPQAMVIITAVFPPEKIGTAFGVLSAAAGVAAVLGPVLGGAITAVFGWKWIFLINVPVGLAGIMLILGGVPKAIETTRRKLDVQGLSLCFAGLLLTSFGLIEGQRYGWGRITSFLTVPLIILMGLVLLVAFVLSQRGRPHALVPLTLLRRRTFVIMNLVTGLTTFALLGLYVPLTLYLQFVLEMPADQAGLTMAAMPLLSMVTALAAGALVDRFGGKIVLIAGLTGFVAGLVCIVGVAGSDTSGIALQPGLLLIGLGTGLAFPPMTTLAMRDIPTAIAGTAAGIFNSATQLGYVLSAAAVGALLQNRVAAALPESAGDQRHPIILVAHALDGRSQAYAAALKPSLLLSIVVLIVGLACATALPPVVRERVRGSARTHPPTSTEGMRNPG